MLGLLAGAGLLIGDGKLVDWLLDRRYFRLPVAAAKNKGRARMSSLSVRRVDHVFGMTDLVLGLPFFVSNQGVGPLAAGSACLKRKNSCQ